MAFVPPLRPLDSGFRRKDEVGRQQDKMCRAPVEDVMVLTWDNLVHTKDEKKGRRRCVDVGGGIAIDVLSRDVSAWILAPYRGTGQAFVTNRSSRLSPAHQGMKNHELWFGTANRHGGFCNAPPQPQRGTSPSPREVFDRATFPSPHPSGFRPSPE